MFVMAEYLHKELTDKIIGAAYAVHNELGYGFLEKVYHNAFAIELRKNGFSVESEKDFAVHYDGVKVGDYYADLVVNDEVIVEVKAVENYDKAFEAQLLNYLTAAGMKVGLVINFGRSVQVKRMVL